MSRSTFIATCLLALTVSGGASAQTQAATYPVKPIRMIVPYAAGGGLDAVTRAVAQGMSEVLGQSILVENKAGAGGTIGAEFVARATPDGYTLLSGANPDLVIAPALTPSTVRYNVAKDFMPIVLMAESPNILFVHPSVTGSLADILSGKYKVDTAVATPGPGSPQHIALSVLNSVSKQQLVHVPYKGAGPAVADVISGQIKFGIVGAPPVMAHMKAGKLRALAVTQAKRTPLAPEIPTFQELIDTEEVDAFSTWYGLLAPTGTPPHVVDALHTAALNVLARPDMKAKLTAMGTDVVRMPAGPFADRMRTEAKRYEEIVQRFNIKVD